MSLFSSYAQHHRRIYQALEDRNQEALEAAISAHIDHFIHEAKSKKTVKDTKGG
jgi:DNA-binding GntR family transcriptional regulator